MWQMVEYKAAFKKKGWLEGGYDKKPDNARKGGAGGVLQRRKGMKTSGSFKTLDPEKRVSRVNNEVEGRNKNA